MSLKVMASFSALGGDLPSIAFIIIVLHSLEGSVLWSNVSTNFPCVSPVFICSSGDLVVHLLKGGRGGISGSEVVSFSHHFQYFRWNWFRINMVSSTGYAAFRMMVHKIFSPFWQFDGSRLLLSLSSVSLRYRSQFAFFTLKLVRWGMGLILVVFLSMCLFVLCALYLTVLVNCLLNAFAICVGDVTVFSLKVIVLFFGLCWCFVG